MPRRAAPLLIGGRRAYRHALAMRRPRALGLTGSMGPAALVPRILIMATVVQSAAQGSPAWQPRLAPRPNRKARNARMPAESSLSPGQASSHHIRSTALASVGVFCTLRSSQTVQILHSTFLPTIAGFATRYLASNGWPDFASFLVISEPLPSQPAGPDLEERRW